MKNIILNNPESGLRIITDKAPNPRTNYIQVVGEGCVELIINSKMYNANTKGNWLKICFNPKYYTRDTYLFLSLDEFPDLIHLEIIDMKYGIGVKINSDVVYYLLNKDNIDELRNLKELRALDISYLDGVECLNKIVLLNKLHSLKVTISNSEQDSIENLRIDDITKYTQIRCLDLTLENCYPQLSNLSKLKNLQFLFFEYNHIRYEKEEGLDVNFISEFNKLLLCDICSKEITDFSFLNNLQKLNILTLKNPIGLCKIDLITILPLLEYLEIIAPRNLENLDFLFLTPNIESLNIDFGFYQQKIENFLPISSLKNLKSLYLNDLREITSLNFINSCTLLRKLELKNFPNSKLDNDFEKLTNLNYLDISSARLNNLGNIYGASALKTLKLNYCEKLTRVACISKQKTLINLELAECSNIRDFNSLASLPNLEKLEWIDSVACSQVLIQSASNRHDQQFITDNAEKWIGEIELSKDATDFLSKLLRAISLLKGENNHRLVSALSTAMRSRGLQSEGLNDLDVFTWETWCDLVIALDLNDAITTLKSSVNDLDIERETEVLLGPVIIAASELIEKYPSEKADLLAWVNEQLLHLHGHPTEERQIAPSAAVFFASLNMKEEVLFWLEKATDQKAPMWCDKVLAALINHYAQKEEFAECRRLLDLIQIDEQRDKAISSIAVAMGEKYPVEAAFLLDDIKELSISTATANRLLQQSSVLSRPQGIYQLLLHLQSNPEELASTITTLIEKDQEGKVANAVKQLFLQKQPAGPSAAVLLELCKHPAISDFVKPRVLEKYKIHLLERVNKECAESIDLLLSEMQQEEMIDKEEANELLQLMQQS